MLSSQLSLYPKDTLFLQAMLEQILGNKYKILHAINGKEAVEHCENNPDIQFVFMDLKMPVMNGIEATEKIKAIKPNITICAQTAYNSEEYKKKSLDAGCSEFLEKPIKKDMLINILNTYLPN